MPTYWFQGVTEQEAPVRDVLVLAAESGSSESGKCSGDCFNYVTDSMIKVFALFGFGYVLIRVIGEFDKCFSGSLCGDKQCAGQCTTVRVNRCSRKRC